MPPPNSCGECVRLWTAYEASVKAHIQVMTEYQLAVSEQDVANTLRLEPMLQEALKRRSDARQAVNDHEITHHRDAPAV
jgi:hypothetical protein